MKLNIANPSTGAQKLIEIDDDNKLRVFFDKRISQEVEGDNLGDEFKGYVFRIAGGHDKQGFAMKQGVLTNTRVRLLLGSGDSGFRGYNRRVGERRRKSVRGCIVGPDLATINLILVKQGTAEIAGLTDRTLPRRLGPKRANNIRKLFNLAKTDDVRKFVVRRTITREGKKDYSKAPKIQRLVTPKRLQRKRALRAEKLKGVVASKQKMAEYQKMLASLKKEKRTERRSSKRSGKN